jgi:DNA modification methylase
MFVDTKIIKAFMPAVRLKQLQTRFRGRVNNDWSFSDNRSIDTWTHGYHRYPAKFIPQVVKKLLETYTQEGDRVADVFAGCGTTLVECRVHGRSSIGVDINPVAQMITNAKINPIKPPLLKRHNDFIEKKIGSYRARPDYWAIKHDRIDYWFRRSEKNKIAFLYDTILSFKDDRTKDFFLCALSNILKNCSRWLQDSTKPQTDPTKKIAEPFSAFSSQVKKMSKRNEEFYNKLVSEKTTSTPCHIKLADARKTHIRSGSVNAIITSPPYVTSYEYADIHQLTAYWFDYITDLSQFRKKFIGTFYSQNKNLKVDSKIAGQIIQRIVKKDLRLANEVANYFSDMSDVASEMHRILAPQGVVCLVVGNTKLRNVLVKSAEAFAETLSLKGFQIVDVIKRKITSKQIPTIRDKVDGRFTKLSNKNSRKIYPNEFIIIARKPR